VSNNSWGGTGQSQAMDDAVSYEHQAGMVVAVAAGNSNTDALSFVPASADDAVTVAASNSNDARACFSNFGQKIDVAAPGGDSPNCGGLNDYILSAKASNNVMCTSSDDYCGARGTSMATPHVAGLAALMLSRNPALTPEDVRQLLRRGAT